MATTALSPLERCEQHPDARLEFDGTRIIESSGTSADHGSVSTEIVRILKNLADRLDPKPRVLQGPGF